MALGPQNITAKNELGDKQVRGEETFLLPYFISVRMTKPCLVQP